MPQAGGLGAILLAIAEVCFEGCIARLLDLCEAGAQRLQLHRRLVGTLVRRRRTLAVLPVTGLLLGEERLKTSNVVGESVALTDEFVDTVSGLRQLLLGRLERLLGRLESDLRYLEPADILSRGPVAFLGGIQETCAKEGMEIARECFV